jgi:AcrR family transcriptional regulator
VAAGLRERKKQALRDQLSLAALELANERGLANVRVEDIVERVGVSRRTFSNYYASKEDAIVDRLLLRVNQAAEAIRRRPEGESLWEALTAAMIEPFRTWGGALGPQSKEVLDNLRTVLSEPDLQAAIARGSRTAQEELTQAIAERTGTDPRRDLYPSLVSAAAITVQLVVPDFWVRADPPVPLLPLLVEAFQQLKEGLHTPLPRRPE